MAASEITFMGKILKNSSNQYIAMYFHPSENDQNNAISDNFYWVDCNSVGDIIDSRTNAKNGYFTSYDDAMGNIPSGYSDVTPDEDFLNKREWGYKPDFPFDSGFVVGGDNVSLNNAFRDITQYVNAGITYVAMSLYWDDVFLSLSEQNTNADSSWARYDAFANFVKNVNPTLKLAIRIVVSKAGRTHNDMQGTYNPTSNLWPLSKAQKDNSGNVIRVQYDSGTFSYADSSATSQAIDFVTKVKNRYSSLMGGRLHWISVATTTQEEAGYDYENLWNGTDYYSSPVKKVYDYSDAAKSE